MEEVSRRKVTGVKFFEGNIDGKQIDSGKVFIETGLDFTTKRQKGYASVEYSLQDSAAAKQLMANEFPFFADVTSVRVVSGDSTKEVIISIKPIPVDITTPVKKAA